MMVGDVTAAEADEGPPQRPNNAIFILCGSAACSLCMICYGGVMVVMGGIAFLARKGAADSWTNKPWAQESCVVVESGISTPWLVTIVEPVEPFATCRPAWWAQPGSTGPGVYGDGTWDSKDMASKCAPGSSERGDMASCIRHGNEVWPQHDNWNRRRKANPYSCMQYSVSWVHVKVNGKERCAFMSGAELPSFEYFGLPAVFSPEEFDRKYCKGCVINCSVLPDDDCIVAFQPVHEGMAMWNMAMSSYIPFSAKVLCVGCIGLCVALLVGYFFLRETDTATKHAPLDQQGD